jgi:hypothetical protein
MKQQKRELKTSSLPRLSQLAALTSSFQPRWNVRKHLDDAGGGGKSWVVYHWDTSDMAPRSLAQMVIGARFAWRSEALLYMRQVNEEEHIRFIFENMKPFPNLNLDRFLEAPLLPDADTFRIYSEASPPDDNGKE